MPKNTIKFDEIFRIYSSLLSDNSALYPISKAEIKLANDKEWRNRKPRAITLGFPGRKWRADQGHFKCLTEKYHYCPNVG